MNSSSRSPESSETLRARLAILYYRPTRKPRYAKGTIFTRCIRCSEDLKGHDFNRAEKAMKLWLGFSP